eukprot:15319-Rhodomonas_salina.2
MCDDVRCRQRVCVLMCVVCALTCVERRVCALMCDADSASASRCAVPSVCALMCGVHRVSASCFA